MAYEVYEGSFKALDNPLTTSFPLVATNKLENINAYTRERRSAVRGRGAPLSPNRAYRKGQRTTSSPRLRSVARTIV